MDLSRDAPIAAAQELTATRAQLVEAGFTRHEIAAQVDAHRWTTWGSHVVILHNFTPTRRQLMWAATLDAGAPAALGSHTALELAGFRAFAREAEQIHLLLPRGWRAYHRDSRVTIHETRRIEEHRHLLDHLPRRVETARAAVDAAAWQPFPRFACALVSAVVQQRLCTVGQIDEAMHYVGRVRHKAYLRTTLRDLAGGSEALSEHDLTLLCRRHGLMTPTRQVRRRDKSGRLRYLDAVWELSDGRTIVLEVDGAHHMDVTQWQDDVRRERDLVVAGIQVLRATGIEVRVEPQLVADDLVAIGVPRLVRHDDAQSRHLV